MIWMLQLFYNNVGIPIGILSYEIARNRLELHDIARNWRNCTKLMGSQLHKSKIPLRWKPYNFATKLYPNIWFKQSYLSLTFVLAHVGFNVGGSVSVGIRHRPKQFLSLRDTQFYPFQILVTAKNVSEKSFRK